MQWWELTGTAVNGDPKYPQVVLQYLVEEAIALSPYQPENTAHVLINKLFTDYRVQRESNVLHCTS